MMFVSFTTNEITDANITTIKHRPDLKHFRLIVNFKNFLVEAPQPLHKAAFFKLRY